MKKTILATALLAATGVAQAATTHTMENGRFDFLNASGVVTADGHDDVQGSFDMVNGTGSFTTSTPFNGVTWSADVVSMDMHSSMGTGTATGTGEAHDFTWTNYTYWTGSEATVCRVSGSIDGCTENGVSGMLMGSSTNSYSYTLNDFQFAAGVFFDWSVNNDIPVLAIMQVTAQYPDGSMDVVSVGDDCNADNTVCGTAMVTSPFPGQTPVFSGTIAPVGAPAEVPVPAAVWLFGSGLVGLAGIARRRKTA